MLPLVLVGAAIEIIEAWAPLLHDQRQELICLGVDSWSWSGVFQGWKISVARVETWWGRCISCISAHVYENENADLLQAVFSSLRSLFLNLQLRSWFACIRFSKIYSRDKCSRQLHSVNYTCSDLFYENQSGIYVSSPKSSGSPLLINWL